MLGRCSLLALTIAPARAVSRARRCRRRSTAPSATALATELARDYPDRAPGSAGAAGAAELGRRRSSRSTASRRARTPGTRRSRASAASGCATSSPSSRARRADAILVLAHRDDTGAGPGANDNASGTAALIELARGYGRLGTSAGRPKPMHTLIFLSSDGGAFGGFGAERFAARRRSATGSTRSSRSTALAGSARPRLELAGFAPRSPAPALVRTADVAVAAPDSAGRPRGRAGSSSSSTSACRSATASRRRSSAAGSRRSRSRRAATTPARPAATRGAARPARFVRLGRAADSILASLDGGIELARRHRRHVYLGDRIVRGWAIELVLLVALVPFLVGAIDLFARCRRRRLPLAPALAGAPHAARRLALGRAPRRARRAGRRVPARLGDPAAARQPRGDRLAGRRAARPRRARSARLVRARAGCSPRRARRRRGGARRLRGGARRARRRRRRDRARQPVRARLRRCRRSTPGCGCRSCAAPAGLATSSTASASSARRSRSSRSHASSASGSTRRCTSSR